MPQFWTRTRRRLQDENTCLKAVNAALYQTIDTMTRAAVAAGVDVGWAEGERRNLALDRDIERLLDQDGNWS